MWGSHIVAAVTILLGPEKSEAAAAETLAMVDSLCGERREVDTTFAKLGAALGSKFTRDAASALEM